MVSGYNGTTVETDHGTWKVVPDSSISGSANGEIVSPILNWTHLEKVQQVVRAVRAAGAVADSSCGIHVHIGCADLEPAAVARIAKTINKQERLIVHALGVAPARAGRYCRPVEPAFLERLTRATVLTRDALNRAWYGHHNAAPQRYDHSRYHGLNLNSYFVRGTIEFRYFNGTLHAGKVKSYIQLCLALVARGACSKSASAKVREFNEATSRYDMRVLLLSLGMIGEEFATARLHLSAHLQGNASWKDDSARGAGRGGRNRRSDPPAAPAASEPPAEGQG